MLVADTEQAVQLRHAALFVGVLRSAERDSQGSTVPVKGDGLIDSAGRGRRTSARVARTRRTSRRSRLTPSLCGC